jgi:6-phosphogluconolactonase (cycloisomerase 2 family)
MRIGSRAWLLLMAAPLLTGCANFWQAPDSSNSFTLTNSGNISVAQSTTGTSTITVTPANSFTGTVALTCAVTSSLSSPTSPTCSLSSTSVSITGTSAETSTLTVTTASATTLGAYTIKVTGTSGSLTGSTSLCAQVSNSSATCASTATSSGNFYILNNGTSGSVTGYSISSSQLTRIGSSVSLATVTPVAMAISPNGKFLCVSTSSSSGGVVFAYPITNGVLGTAVQVTGDLAYSLQIDSTNSWLIEAIPFNGGTGGVILSAVPINPATGAYTQATIPSATITLAGATLPPGQMAISGDNSSLFVALGTGGTAVVPFNSSNPFPSGTSYTHIAVAKTGGSALSVAVDRGTTPRLFYIGETLGNSAGTSGGLRAFTYASLSTSTLVQPSGSPIASGGLSPTFILPVATPDYVYVADKAGTITGFAVTGSSSSYTITTGSTVTAGSQPAGMALDSTGSFVFEVGSSGSPYFDAYTFDSGTTGLLDSQVTSTSAATSIAIVAAP